MSDEENRLIIEERIRLIKQSLNKEEYEKKFIRLQKMLKYLDDRFPYH